MRDKVKRFISILMTALMLVNLMPVGALADGITSIGYKPEVAASTGNYTVYVYARFDGDPLPGVTLNASQWYTIGYIANVNLPSPGGISFGQYWYYNNNNYCGSTINSTSASGIIGGLVHQYNTSIVINPNEWISANFKACPGADTYKEGTSEPTWHLDIIVDINKNPPVHNLVFKVNNSNGKQIGTPKKVTGRWANPLSANKYYAGDPVPETIIDGGIKYQLKTKREGNPNLDTKIYFDEPIKNVEFYYKDMGPVVRNYTVNHYWVGDQNTPIRKETKEAALGSTVKASPATIEGYTITPESNKEKSITITEGTNEINFYYYKNVTLTANSDTKTYNGQEQSVSGFTGAPEDADFSAITVGASGKDAGKYYAIFPTGTKGTVDGTGKYIVTEAINGQLVIEKRNVTLTSGSGEKVYDGTPLTKDEVTASGEGFVKDEGATYKVTGTLTDVGETANTFTYELKEGTKAGNYEIAKVEGKLKVTAATDKVVVTIKGHKGSYTYNGEEQSVEGYDVTIPEGSAYTKNDITFNGHAKAKGTDAGKYDMGLNKSQFTNNNGNFTNVTFEVVEDGKLEISPRSVTLTSANAEKVYDGTPLTKDEVTASGEGFVKGEGATYDVTGSQTVVGSSKNTFSYKLKDNTKAENYTITTSEGTLEVTAATDEVVVTIKENAGTAKYDGTEKTVTGYTVTNISNKLYAEKDFTFNGKAEVKGTDAGTYDMALKASDFTNRNANFSKVTFVIEDGQLVIEKRKVTLTSGSGEKVYDGTALTNGTVTVGGADGFADGEGAAYDVTGSQTVVGESDNTFTYTLKKGTKADNYTIEKTEGKLKVTPVTDEVVVTIKENAGTAKYDGTEKTVTGYTVTNISNKLYAEKDFTFNGTAEVKGTDAGTYDMALKSEDFTNTNANFAKVTFKIEDGQLVIEKRKVTLTSASDEKVYDGTALTKPVVTVGGDGFVEGQVKEIKATGSVTNAGSVANTITFTPNKETFKEGNYAITKTEGTLTIAKRSVLITSQSATKTYDGSALTRPAVTITGDGFVPGELAKAEATGSITNVGSTPNAIRYATTGAFNAANYSIALSVGTLTVTEKPKPEPRRTFNLTINYVYQNGKRAAASYNRGGLKNGETFDITSPVIAGYTASETVVSGTIYNRDIKVTVIYTADGVNLDDYGVPLGLGNITMNVGDCFE